jgi:hypothetical protein
MFSLRVGFVTFWTSVSPPVILVRHPRQLAGQSGIIVHFRHSARLLCKVCTEDVVLFSTNYRVTERVCSNLISEGISAKPIAEMKIHCPWYVIVSIYVGREKHLKDL